MFTREFDFQNNKSCFTMFSMEKGYGFIDFNHIEGKTHSEQSIYSGGWNHRLSDTQSFHDFCEVSDTGVRIKDAREVIIFKLLVPEDGSYKVTLTCTAGMEPIENMSVFAGRRNLIARDICVAPRNTCEKEFYTYVAPYIPAMTSVPCTEKAIYISITGKNATLTGLTIKKQDVSTVFVAGDSTLTDQNALYPYYPYGSCGGWAQMLSSHLHGMAVCNQAHSGMTTNCFRDDGHWDIITSHISPGDVVLFQFGHNDQKRRNLAAFGGYLNNLKWYAERTRALGATPVILSPISRIPITDEEETYSLLSLHALACKEAAKECKVPFIDLHAFTFEKWKSLGESAHDYFMSGDITHTNDYGASMIAKLVVSELQSLQVEPLFSHLTNEKLSDFLPEQDTKVLPKEPAATAGMFDIDFPYVDMKNHPKYDSCVSALRMGLLDPCVMHLHPDDGMPRAQFLMIYLRALRMNGERPYRGSFCDISKYEWDSSYVQTCIRENFIDKETVTQEHFRPDDFLTYEEFASFVIRGMEAEKKKREISLTNCFEKVKALSILDSASNPKDMITRAEVYAGLVQVMNLLSNASKELPSDAEIHPVG